MLRKPRAILPVAVLFLIAAACFVLWFFRTHYLNAALDVKIIVSENGVWDLRSVDFDKSVVQLSGDGEMIANALLTPEEFDMRHTEATPDGYETAQSLTTRIRVLLPDDAMYAVAGETVDYADRFYVNGQHRLDIGTVGTDAASSEPRFALFNMDVQGPQLDIVRQSSNFQHRALHSQTDLFIGRPDVLRRFESLKTDMTGFFMGMFFVLFVCHGLLYLIFRRYRANLYFALLCLAWCLRTGISSAAVLPSWFPGIPWQAFLRIEYTLVGVAAVCLAFIIGEVFPAALPRWLKRFIVIFTAAYTVLCLAMPTLQLSWAWVPCACVYIACGIIIQLRLVQDLFRRVKMHNMQSEQWLLAGSLLLLFTTATLDVLYYNGFTSFGILNDLGFLIFAFFMMVINLAGTMREIQVVQRTEQEARLESETLRRAGEMKEEFLQNLSHELQMPITVISGFAQLTMQMLTDEPTDRAAIADNMRRVDDEATRMTRMVSLLLDEAAMDNGSFMLRCEPVDIAALISTVASIHIPVMNNGYSNIVLEVSERLVVRGDEERLLQVILNLISNALKHMENGTVTLKACRKGKMAYITVADTGSGFAPELIPTLFQRFTKHDEMKGNGLGLYICRRIIEAHGGKIGIDESYEGGASVWFTVPMEEEQL